MESLKAFALKHNATSGKWLIPVPWIEADEIWGKLVRNFLSGIFSKELGVLFVKVHGRSTPEDNPHNQGKKNVFDLIQALSNS
jgi:hypothetical protein